MKPQIVAAVLVIVTAQVPARAAEPLTKSRIEGLIALPDSGQPMPDPLSFYPRAREYTATARLTTAEGQVHEMPAATVREKLVAGGFLVSSVTFPDAPADLHMVVYYDKANGVYRKSVLPPVGEVAHAIGTRVDGSDSISWIMHSTTPDGQLQVVLSHERHTEKESTWREVFITDGKVTQSIDGKAVVVKRAD